MSDYERYRDLLVEVDEHVRFFELHPDFAVRRQAVALLTGLDGLHREGLGRLVERLREAGAGPALDQAVTDPIVRTLLGLYDFADLGLPGGFVPIERLRQSRTDDRSPGPRGPE